MYKTPQKTSYKSTTLGFVFFLALSSIGLIFSRIKRGISWSTPGRDHIHHKLMHDYSPEGALGIILLISLCTGLLGITLENSFEPWVSTIMFLLFASFYYIYAYGYSNFKTKLIN